MMLRVQGHQEVDGPLGAVGIQAGDESIEGSGEPVLVHGEVGRELLRTRSSA